MIKQCVVCNSDIDISLHASAHCTKHKNEICWTCAHQGRNCGIEGEYCSLCMITNPQWVVNLLRSQKCSDGGGEECQTSEVANGVSS